MNDLGTTTPIELAVFAAASLEACAARGLIVRSQDSAKRLLPFFFHECDIYGTRSWSSLVCDASPDGQ